MAGDLKPAPLKPSWPLRQAPGGGLRVPLVHAARVEEERAVARLDVLAVCVPEHNRVGAPVSPVQELRKRRVRVQTAETESPQQCLRLLHPSGPIAMNQHDAPPFDDDLAAQRKCSHVSIVITPNCLDRCDLFQRGDGLGLADVAGMENQVDPA